MRLLLDEMLTHKIAVQLPARELDVVAVTERVGLVSLPDEQILEAAISEDRVLVTTNISDFAVLAARFVAEGRPHAGIVFVPAARFPPGRGFIGSLVEALSAGLLAGELPDPGEVAYLRRRS